MVGNSEWGGPFVYRRRTEMEAEILADNSLDELPILTAVNLLLAGGTVIGSGGAISLS